MALNHERLLTAVTSNTSLLNPLLTPLGFAPFLHITRMPFLLHRRMHSSSVVISFDQSLICYLSKWEPSWNYSFLGFSASTNMGFFFEFLVIKCQKDSSRRLYTKLCHKVSLSRGATWVEDFGSRWVPPCVAWLPGYKSFPE